MKIKLLIIVLIIVPFTLTGSKNYKTDQTNIFCKMVNISKNTNNYEKEWEKVKNYVKKGLPKSALKVVDEIYTKAKHEHNSPQFIKAVLYKMRLISDFEEDFVVKVINDLNKEISQADEPEKQLLNSILAQLYWIYYQNNRYKFLERSQTTTVIEDDIHTWDLNKILQKTIYHYIASLENKELNGKIPIEKYDAIIIKEEDSEKYRPTLYDFLAHRAVDFFMNDESSITQPSYRFEIDDEKYFLPAREFIKLEINTKDTLSLKYHALLILQDLVSFHINDKDPKAFIDANLKRYTFVNNHSVAIANKDSIYIASLKRFEKKYIDYPGSASISYEIAKTYFSLGQQYDPSSSEKYKWEKKKAHEVCESAIKRFPDSYGAKNCTSLKEQIEKIIIELTNEKVNIPDKPILGLLSFQNVKKVYFRIIDIDYRKDRKLRRNNRNNQLINIYRKYNPLKEWSLELPDDGDFQTHSAQVKLPQLPADYYVILMSPDPSFIVKNNGVAFSSTWVSSISYINHLKENGDQEFFVLDRNSGEPMNKVNIAIYTEKYNYKTRNYKFRKIGTYQTDNNGYINIPYTDTKKETFAIEFSYKGDTLFSDDVFRGYRSRHSEKDVITTHFFTDRAIYRPGQTIYFKGITLEKSNDKYDIKDSVKTTVTFYDVNHQEISSLDLVSNDYGSIQGSFIAPTGVLNGEMTIENEYGRISFSVEDYKRPKFEVNLEQPSTSYKLNEKVSVKGNAKAYAGNPIDNAKVKYRVVRKVYFPYFGYRYWGYYPQQPEMEIANGITETDEQGKFSIDFTAIPDLSIEKKFNPVFNYEVHADVTDINGETHSDELNVSVGYKALLIKIEFPDQLNRLEDNDLSIATTNLNNEFVPADITVNISKLNQPKRLFKERQWQQPDVFIINKEEFYELFPNNIYYNENLPVNWKTEKIVFDDKFTTQEKSKLGINNLKNWKEGVYKVTVVTKDKFGEEVKSEKFFELFSIDTKTIPVNKFNWFVSLKNKCEPGDEVSFLFGSKEKVKVLYEIIHRGNIESREWITINNEQEFFEIPVQEKYRGNFGISLLFVKFNRIYQNTQTFTIPYTNKELDIEFATFRDKLKPGQKESWQIKIKGKKGEKVAAEMLATMYDASLDVFRENSWGLNLYSSFPVSSVWDYWRNFQTAGSRFFQQRSWTTTVTRKYNKLNWFGFKFYGHYRYSKVMGVQSLEFDEAEPAPMMGDMVEEEDKMVEPKQEESQEKIPDEAKDTESQPMKVRTDFRETAFFYPDLETNENGEIIINFEMPEALTRWKMMGLAYTKDLKIGNVTKELVTQKELMVVPNAPRFFREGDTIIFTTKIASLSNEDLSVQAEINFYNSFNMKSVNKELQLNNDTKEFTVEKGKSCSLAWKIIIPEGLEAITYRIEATAGNFSDGEEMAIPVLPNRMLVTESLPLPVRGKETKHFKFKKLLESGEYKTIRNYNLSLEFTSNPAWYAVQALPYLMEFPYECSEQVFSRYYSNSLATHIANSSPKIKKVFEAWKNYSPEALLSNLEKNQDLKSVLIEETPWVREAKDESERKKRIALLFDLNKMSYELNNALLKIQQMQSPNGGWPWFEGMPDNRYITQHIVTGFGHLINLGIIKPDSDDNTWDIIKKAVYYLDRRIKEDYQNLKENYQGKLDKDQLGNIQIQYLYARSYFLDDIEISGNNEESFNYYKEQSKKYWVNKDKYMQGMLALALNRYGDNSTPMDIIRSLKEKSLHSEEMGMYWRKKHGWYWYEAPIERQALLIEAFDELTDYEKDIEEMKVWLLKQKQTQDWETTKATTEAIYALLLRGTDLLESDELVDITLGHLKVDPEKQDDVEVEAGTGYFRMNWSGKEIKPDMGNITITKKDKGIAWGALYWQYFQDLDKITQYETPLSLEKDLFIEINTESGPVIKPVDNNSSVEIGDKIIVRIIIRTDRDMEYIHLKDMRASAFEPVNVLSKYKWQEGLGYYESTRDASTNFFIDYLPKGTYVFEYPLIASQKGDFSNGITTIQCMYAPEFSSHSKGIRVTIE